MRERKSPSSRDQVLGTLGSQKEVLGASTNETQDVLRISRPLTSFCWQVLAGGGGSLLTVHLEGLSPGWSAGSAGGLCS